jgi:hypothetical protein
MQIRGFTTQDTVELARLAEKTRLNAPNILRRLARFEFPLRREGVGCEAYAGCRFPFFAISGTLEFYSIWAVRLSLVESLYDGLGVG